MSKNKIQNMNIFQIIFKGILIYFKNIIPLSKAMLFPVFGQLIGIILILYPSYLFSQNLTGKISGQEIINNIILIFLGLIILILPGFFIFTKAFWEYMIAMAATNSMISSIIKQGRLKDINTHKQVIKLRSKEYIILLSILSLIWLIGLTLPVCIILFKNPKNSAVILEFLSVEIISTMILSIATIYLSLSYQVFAFENISPVNVIKKSWNLVEGNFWRTFILGSTVFILTGIIIPKIFQAIFANTVLVTYFAHPVNIYINSIIGGAENIQKLSDIAKTVPLPFKINPAEINTYIIDISKSTVLLISGFIAAGLVLPLGSACYTLLYFDIINKKKINKIIC